MPRCDPHTMPETQVQSCCAAIHCTGTMLNLVLLCASSSSCQADLACSGHLEQYFRQLAVGISSSASDSCMVVMKQAVAWLLFMLLQQLLTAQAAALQNT